MKQYILHQKQLEAIINGARLMVVKIDEDLGSIDSNGNIKYYLPIKQCDGIYIGEEFCLLDFSKLSSDLSEPLIGYKELMKSEAYGGDGSEFKPASEMTYEQSRLRFTVGEVSVKRADDLELDELISLGLPVQDYCETSVNDWLKAQDIEPTDYVALIELKEK